MTFEQQILKAPIGFETLFRREESLTHLTPLPGERLRESWSKLCACGRFFFTDNRGNSMLLQQALSKRGSLES